MEKTLQLGGLTYTLSINAEKQRAVVTGITGAGDSDAAAVLDSSLPELIGWIKIQNDRGQMNIGKLYLMVPEGFEHIPEAHGMRRETRYPGIFKKDARNDGLDYVFIFDPARDIGEQVSAEISRMVAEVGMQQPRRHELRDYTIRRGCVEDAAAIAALLSQVVLFLDEFPQGITGEAIAHLFQDDGFSCYVCEHGGAVVGYLSVLDTVPSVILGYETRELVLDLAAVSPTERRKGIMTELIREARDQADAEGKTWYAYCRVLMDGERAVPTGMHRSMREAGAEFLGILSSAYAIVTDEDTDVQPHRVHAVAWGAAGSALDATTRQKA